VAAIHVASVRGDPFGAVRWTVTVQRTAPQGSPHTPATCIAATTPELIVGILNSVFLNFLNFQMFSNFSEVQTYSLMMIY